MHILNKDSKLQRYFMKSAIAKSVTILSLVTLAMWAGYVMMIEGAPKRVGMIKVLIVRCSDVMPECLRTGCGN